MRPIILFALALLHVSATPPAGRCTAPDGIAAYASAAADAAAAVAGQPEPSFLYILVHHVQTRADRQVILRVAGEQAWLETWSRNVRGKLAEPFVVTDLSPWWRVKSPLAAFTCSELSRVFGELKADYQLHGFGQNVETMDDFDNASAFGEKMSVFARRISSCATNSSNQSSTLTTDNLAAAQPPTMWNAPKWFTLKRSSHPSAKQLWQDLGGAGFGSHSPVYLEGIRFDEHAGTLLRKLYDDGILIEIVDGDDDDDDGDEELVVGAADGTGINGDPERYPVMVRSPRDPLNNPKERFLRGLNAPSMLHLPTRESLHEVFLYAGDKYSGTFFHQHGSGCAMMSEDTRTDSHRHPARLWLLYSPDRYCSLKSLPKHLPKRCPSIDGNCIEGMHPLDVLQHYWELLAYKLAPTLHIQKPGEVFCFPEGYYHATVNLGPSLSVAIVLRKKRYTRNSQCVWDDACEPPLSGFDRERCDDARSKLLHQICAVHSE